MLTLNTFVLVLALVCFLLAFFQVPGRFSWRDGGYALVVLSFLL